MGGDRHHFGGGGSVRVRVTGVRVRVTGVRVTGVWVTGVRVTGDRVRYGEESLRICILVLHGRQGSGERLHDTRVDFDAPEMAVGGQREPNRAHAAEEIQHRIVGSDWMWEGSGVGQTSDDTW